MGRFVFVLLLASMCLVATADSAGQTQPTPFEPVSSGGPIHGSVKSGNMPIPGAAVSVALGSSNQKFSTWTDIDGSYSVAVPSSGSYHVSVQMVAFANSTKDVVVDGTHQDVQTNFELTLRSRTQEAPPQPRRPGGQGGAQGFQRLAELQNMGTQESGGNT